METERGSEGQQRSIGDDALFRIVAQSASDAIITIDRDSTILFANGAAEILFGYSQEELVGAQLTRLMPDYLRRLHEAALARYLETGERHLHWGGVELPGLHRSGREIPLELSFGESVEDGEPLFTGVVRDVSERKRTERRWEAQYSIARILASQSSLDEAAGSILETIGKCLDWQVGVLWQPGEDDLLHASITWHDPALAADEFLAATRDLPFAVAVGVPGRAWQTGEPLWVADVGVDGNYPRKQLAHQAGLRSVFAFPISAEGEFIGAMEFYSPEIREPDSALLNLMKSTAVQIGQYVLRLRAEEEIRTLNRELEGRVLERTEQLRESGRELESFAYSVSHDLRGPLRGIDGFSQMLLDDYGAELDEPAKAHLGRIRTAATRMGDLIDDLLELSRISRRELAKRQVDLSELARLAIAELRQREPRRRVEVVVAPGLTGEGDVKLLRVVLENLLENSWKFTAHTESARIEFGADEIDGRTVYFVRDNGAGFDMLYAEKLFAPFQRLHSPSEFEGTGIGLSTVQRIVQRHGGKVRAEGAIDAGATFFFTL
ncbi:MAG: PAS domain S-box protein [Trueperaceae bacterium]